MAVANLSEQLILADIAKNEKDWRIRCKAITNLHDQETLACFLALQQNRKELNYAISPCNIICEGPGQIRELLPGYRKA